MPGLLPEMIRNADTSPSGSVVRPIAPSRDSLSAGRKFGGSMVLPSRSANRSAVMPATHQFSGGDDAAADGSGATTPSPVQKQLEELYRKDGRPMPQMNFQQTPLPADGRLPIAEGAGHSSVAVPSNVVPPKPRSFLDKINPFIRNRTAPARMPQHPANPIPNNAAAAPQSPAGPTNGMHGINPAGAKLNPTQRAGNPAARAMPMLPAAQPASVAPPTATKSGNELPNTLPPVPGEPGYQGSAQKSGGEAIAVPPAPASIDDALENAFNEKPTSAAAEPTESQPQAPKAEPKSLEEENPFGGLSLDDAFGPAAKPAASAKPATTDPQAAPLAEEPAVGPKSINTLKNDAPIADETPSTESPKQAAQEPTQDEATTPNQDQVDSKMKQIAERGELRGLKGFCPVMLRDERDLKNAMPEHHSVFKGRTYYFSSADTKAAFDEQPQKYAPISGGQDVVLLKETVTKEGSLDHAVLFKDRLYLFTSQKTLEQFVAAPKEFAISE